MISHLPRVTDSFFVASGFSGLRIVDASDPAALEEVGALETPGYARDPHVDGTLVFVAAQTDGVRIVDVSNPEVPVEVGALFVASGSTAEGATHCQPVSL